MQDVWISIKSIKNHANRHYGFMPAFFNMLGPELEQSEGMFNFGWWLWPIGRYVERYGNKDWIISLSFLKELTKRFTGEYAIRPLLQEHHKEVTTILTNLKDDQEKFVQKSVGNNLNDLYKDAPEKADYIIS